LCDAVYKAKATFAEFHPELPGAQKWTELRNAPSSDEVSLTKLLRSKTVSSQKAIIKADPKSLRIALS